MMAAGSPPIRAPDVRELETLVACGAEGSLSAAAARLGISRPAVAKRIKNLEALAGRALLHRGGRGVRLTDAGATLLAGARRILSERDLIVSLLGEIRGEGPSPISGLRALLGSESDSARAAQQPEVRLAETERVLAIIMRASTTALVISDPDTSAVHEANEAFCRFIGRSRAELLVAPTTENRGWFDREDRDRMLEEVRSRGVAERALVRAQHPDGTVRVGQATSRFISLAGTRQLLTTVDDITDQHLLEVERRAGIGCYRAVAQVSKLLKAAKPAVESIAGVLPEIRSTGELTSALLWNLDLGCPEVIAGQQPPGDLGRRLLHGEPLAGTREVQSGGSALDQQVTRGKPLAGTKAVHLGGFRDPRALALKGWAVPLPPTAHALILLTHGPVPWATEALYIEVLSDLAALVASETSA